ncbi:right-handed parallel beta-helix repeat-containing protein [Micromonospora echinaurantiaca]|uniref:right-handed parallel beta-helix repeat-containing protein n=1 Tax=Micromonospora TaxID=1873 RepID=UPI000D6EFC77|nr:hypothetical protein DLJ47_08395 [Micromonospora sp. S4605]
MSTYQGSWRPARPRRRSRWFLTGGVVASSLVAAAVGLGGGAASAADHGLSVPDQGRPVLVPTGDPTDPGHPRRTGERPDGGERRYEAGPQGTHGRPDDLRSGWERAAGGDPQESRGTGDDPRERRDGGGNRWHRDAIAVPCDSAQLIAALVRVNAEGGGTLRLAPKCTYPLTHAFAQPDQYDGGIRDAREAADTAENPGDAEAPPRNPADDKSGLPVIYHPVTVEGAGATIVRKTDAEAFRFFTVRDGGELTLRDVVLRNGRSAAEGGALHVVHGASAVVERTTITHSVSLSAEGGGGAIFNDGNMLVDESTFVSNNAAGKAGKGGGFLNGGVLTMHRSEFRDNSAVAYGGGLANYRGAAEVQTSTFAHNTATHGGGLASFSARTRVSDTKVLGNTAQTGGGLANSDAVLFLRRLTVRDNTATGNGGGISTFQGLVPLDDSVVAGNTARGNGGGLYAEKSNLLVRQSEVSRNGAVGARSTGGGIFASLGQLTLHRSEVIRNGGTSGPGGIHADKARVTVDDETDVIENRPTNCAGSRVPVTHCFR